MPFLNYTINTSLEQITSGQLENIQLSLCKQYDKNIIVPLIVALASMLIRMLIIYKIDKTKYPKVYQYGETMTDVLTVLSIITSIIWISIN